MCQVIDRVIDMCLHVSPCVPVFAVTEEEEFTIVKAALPPQRISLRRLRFRPRQHSRKER